MMKIFYKKAIKLNNSTAMYLLGHHYYCAEQYEKMKEYYNMAIELHNSDAMNNFDVHYFWKQYGYVQPRILKWPLKSKILWLCINWV